MSILISPPDFDDMFETSEKIKTLAVEVELNKLVIKEMEAETVLVVTSDTQYFIDGKKPAFNYINATYKHSGVDGNLGELRKENVALEQELEVTKRGFELKKAMLEVWRTESANKRAAAY